MKIVFLTQYYPPEVGAPQTRLSELAQRFLERRHEVTVVTAMPNYPTGKVQPGFGGLLMRERRAGIDVIRTYVYPTQRADLVRRLANYFSFATSSGVVGAALMPRADFILVESPPLFLGLTGLWLARLHRTRMIFNVSDLWPESAVHVGAISRDSHAYRAAEKLEGLLYRKAWLVSGQSRAIIANVSLRFPDTRTYHLSNGADTRRFHPDCADHKIRESLAPTSEFVILYAGLHGLAQGLEQVLQAAKAMEGDSRCRFVFVGDGPEKAVLRAQADTLGLRNVKFIDPVPSSHMPAMIASADAIIIPLKSDIPGAVPSKLYESMASARPIVYVADGEGAGIVRGAEAGFVVAPGNIAGIEGALRTLLDDPDLCARFGENGRRAAEAHYDRSMIASRFIDYLEQHLGD